MAPARPEFCPTPAFGHPSPLAWRGANNFTVLPLIADADDPCHKPLSTPVGRGGRRPGWGRLLFCQTQFRHVIAALTFPRAGAERQEIAVGTDGGQRFGADGVKIGFQNFQSQPSQVFFQS